ncbi:MAG: histidine kinase [Chitinophagaceae bacterium]|nr:MAG: histidine kinase [Chitinophagaceae bacterium]
MSRKQLWIIYAVLCFLLTWGWGLVDTLKFKGSINWNEAFSPWHFSQVLYMLITFWLTRFIFRKYYISRRYIALALACGVLVVVFIALRYTIEEKIFYTLFGIRNYPAQVKFQYYALDNVYYAIVYIVLGTLVFLMDNQITAQRTAASLQQERITAELAFLRSQVSPHFLFNSLNNIYSLSYKKSDKAPDAILKLSELTRYMLYEKQDLVPLEKEWDYIRNFISLQQLRYDTALQLEMESAGSMQDWNIAPYLLIPFVENAFKHGDVQDSLSPLSLRLHCTPGQMTFEAINSIAKRHKDDDGGIGLENVRRRLQLIYPNKHQLAVKGTNGRFEVTLKIFK